MAFMLSHFLDLHAASGAVYHGLTSDHKNSMEAFERRHALSSNSFVLGSPMTSPLNMT